MKHKVSKAISALLSLSLMATLMVAPASAAEGRTVRADYDGEDVYTETYPDGYRVKDQEILDIGVGLDAEVTVTSGSYTKTSTKRPISMSGTLPNGTKYSLTESSRRIVSLSATDGLKDDIEISVATTPHTYKISANSGPVGFKSDLGSTGSPTCSVSESSQTVDGNESWVVAFDPYDGETIKSLNIRGTSTGRNIVPVSKSAVTVANTDIQIEKAANGSVTVSAAHAAGDVYITALTAAKAAQLELAVSTSAGIAADAETDYVDAGTRRQITFTPGSGLFVDTISITDGSASAIIGPNDRSVKVNGHTYSVDRSLKGKVVLSVPAMTADVSIEAVSTSDKGYLVIDADRAISCNYPRESLISTGRNHEIRLDTKDDDISISYVTIETATDKVTVDRDTYRFYLDGRYSFVTYDGSAVYFNVYVSGNMKITVHTKADYHTVTLKTDSGARHDERSDLLSVEDGDTQDVTFVPYKGETIQKISITRRGSTNTVRVSAGSILVNGTRCPITENADGSVTVRLKDVTADMTVKAITDATDRRDYTISISAETGASSTKDRIYVDRNKDATVNFIPADECKITSVVISRNGRNYTVRSGEKSVLIDGTRHTVTWARSGKVTVELKNVTDDMEVRARTSYVAPSQDPDVIPPSHDTNINIIVPSKPATPVEPTYDSHTAYLGGYSYGRFMPEQNTSRAQALAILVRAFYGLNDDSVRAYGCHPIFGDVATTEWFAPYLTFAYDRGFIAGLSGTAAGFRPYAPITRAEFTEMACRFAGVDPNGNYGYLFPDVSPVHACYSSIGYAAAKGWIGGYADGSFRPDLPITRAAMAVIIDRVMGRVPDQAFINANLYAMKTFVDVPVTHWAFYDIMEATNSHRYAKNGGFEAWSSLC